MSKSTKIKLLIILAAICCTATLFAGCAGELKANSFLEQNNALNQQITYYSNGGYFDDKDNALEKNIYYHGGDMVITDFDSIEGKSIKREDYIFNGWYYAVTTDKLDEEGNPELDAEGNRIQVPVFEDEDKKIVKASNTPLETDKKMTANTHLYVCASWKDDVKLQIKLVSDVSITFTVDGKTETVENGELIKSQKFLGGTVTIGKTAPGTTTDNVTFLQYYSDAECKTPAPNAIQKPTGDDAEEQATIYAKYITGKWDVVKTADDVSNMFYYMYEKRQFYILNDIDCASISLNPVPHDNYSTDVDCLIEGNGYTLKNLKIGYAQGTGITAGGTYSIFGTLGENAKIKDLTLDGVTLTYSTRVTVNGFYFFCSADNGATFENFKIKNAEMKVDHSEGVMVMNIQKIGDSYQSNNWLFGNVTDDGDYTKRAEGQLTIDGLKLTVGGNEVVNLPASAEAQN